MKLRPFFSYYGGKWRSAVKYPKPLHAHIVEPFAGSAGYALRYPDRKVTLCDVDEHICGVWSYLTQVSEAEILALPDVAHGQDVRSLGLPQEVQWLIGFWLNKGSASPCKTPSKWMCEYPRQFWGQRIRERIAGQLSAIRHWTIKQCRYQDIDDFANATWFVDPLYQVKGTHYRHGSGDIDFDHLARWCRQMATKGQVIVCEQEGADWLPFEFFGAEKSVKGKSREIWWSNKGRFSP